MDKSVPSSKYSPTISKWTNLGSSVICSRVWAQQILWLITCHLLARSAWLEAVFNLENSEFFHSQKISKFLVINKKQRQNSMFAMIFVGCQSEEANVLFQQHMAKREIRIVKWKDGQGDLFVPSINTFTGTNLFVSGDCFTDSLHKSPFFTHHLGNIVIATLPETNIAPKNGWLEDYPFLLSFLPTTQQANLRVTEHPFLGHFSRAWNHWSSTCFIAIVSAEHHPWFSQNWLDPPKNWITQEILNQLASCLLAPIFEGKKQKETIYTTWKVDGVLVYHGPLLIHLLEVVPSTFQMVY